MLIQLGKHHKIFGISTKVNSISCPNDNIHFSLVHMLDLDIIVAGIDNIHSTYCIFWEIWFSGILKLWWWFGPEVLVTDDDHAGGKVSANSDHKENAESQILFFCLPHKGIVLSRLSVIWVSTKTCVHCNALDLWDQVKRTKKRTLEVEKDWIAREGTRLNRNEFLLPMRL